jgi:hypothetical protein
LPAHKQKAAAAKKKRKRGGMSLSLISLSESSVEVFGFDRRGERGGAVDLFFQNCHTRNEQKLQYIKDLLAITLTAEILRTSRVAIGFILVKSSQVKGNLGTVSSKRDHRAEDRNQEKGRRKKRFI